MRKIMGTIFALAALIVLTSCDSIITRSVEYVYDDATVVANSNTITDLVSDLNNSCVGIYAESASTSSSGSGVVYDEVDNYYYVLTNHHVIDEMTTVKIFLGGIIYYDATVVAYDETNDLACLKFSSDLFGGDVSPLDIRSYENVVTVGETIIAIGCPLGLEYYNTVTTGNISNLHYDMIQHDAAINPGNSGGGLFNLQGKLIGLNVSKLTDIESENTKIAVEGMGFAIPMNVILNFIDSYAESDTSFVVERPTLGISGYVINRYISGEDDVAMLPSTISQAVLVESLSLNSVAEDAGMQENDVIKSYDGTTIQSVEQLKSLLNLAHYDDEVVIEVYRKSGSTFSIVSLTVTL